MMIMLPFVLALAMSNPVSIAACSLDAETVPESSGDSPTQETIGTLLSIRFANDSDKPISAVTFVVDDNGRPFTILDKGTFSPGVAISHFWNEGMIDFGDVSCSVTSVEYADGTSWVSAPGS
jgi:hypothetical protein